MILDENPFTRDLHKRIKSEIEFSFPELQYGLSDDYLSIYSYISKSPQKFFNLETFNLYYEYLENQKNSNPDLLAKALNDNSRELSIGNHIINEVNSLSIHDILLPVDDMELIEFIDKNIHYNYLRLLEGPFYQAILILAKLSRISRGKSTDGLDVFNAVQELENSQFASILQSYNNGIRNGIGHGKVIYRTHETEYHDKQGKKVEIGTKEIIQMFDKMLDDVNALYLGLKTFYLRNQVFVIEHNLSVPFTILVEELKAKTEGPGWIIQNCLDTFDSAKSKKQLAIYTYNTFWDYKKVLYHCFNAAILADRFTEGYERFFINLKSKNALSGWAAFDAKKLREIRLKGYTSVSDFKDVLENNILMFPVKRKFPKVFYKLGSLRAAMYVQRRLYKENFRENYKPVKFIGRSSKSKTQKGYVVIQHASVVISERYLNGVQDLIRKNLNEILKCAIKHDRNSRSILGKIFRKPVRYARVYVYMRDQRIRNLQFAGLPESLICTIQINTTGIIKTPDIFHGEVEDNGKFRLVWNRSWLTKFSPS